MVASIPGCCVVIGAGDERGEALDVIVGACIIFVGVGFVGGGVIVSV